MMDKPRTEEERREGQRFGISTPITIFWGKREIPGFTRDLNNLGVYFFLELAGDVSIGENLEFLIELPPEITLSAWCHVRCRSRVVRIDRAAMQLTGIAARILDYSIEREQALSA